MRFDRLDRMVRGWFIGDFEPTTLKTQACEVGIKHYKRGDYEERHHHRIATEITVITEGEVEMCGKRFSKGDIIVIEPGDSTDFRALTDAANVVVKIPGAKNDKYVGENKNV
jgi:quercetin dioxygenase-like cupin family protein